MNVIDKINNMAHKMVHEIGNKFGNNLAMILVIGMVALYTPFHVNAQSVDEAELPIIIPNPSAEGGLPTTAPQSNRETEMQGEILRQVVIEGARRVDAASVNSYLGLEAGDIINDVVVNEALKRMFETGLFADVMIRQDGDKLLVSIVENPIINRIAFEGNDKIKDEVLSVEVQLRPRVVFTRTKVQSDVQRILDIYRRQGRFAATVAPKVIELEQNRIDLVFEINEGEKTGISEVNFVGNRFFSDNALTDIINTKPSRWYRFLSNYDTYDPDKLAYDKELLRRYYLENGFADFRVLSAVAELAEDNKNFFITITVEEGERYRFGEFKLSSKIEDLKADPLFPLIELETGDWYDASAVDETVDIIADHAGNQGYAFVNVRPRVTRDEEEKRIDVHFEILEAPKVFVERINIKGNVRTLDNVIRREMVLVEGDSFNTSKVNRSRQRINNLGYFSNVTVQNVPGSTDDKTIIDIEVEEQSTGELTIGAGFSTNDGFLSNLQIRERNLMGKGQDLRLSLGLAQKSQSIDLSFTEPYFRGEDVAAGFDLFHIVRDNQDSSSYDSKDSGGGLRMGYEINSQWSQNLRIRFNDQTIENIPSSASQYVKDDEGTNVLVSLGQTLSFDTRNSRIEPTEGALVSLSLDITGGDQSFGEAELSGSYYIPILEDVTLKTGASVGLIHNFGDPLRVSDRKFLGGDNLRAFAGGGVGPRDMDTKDALGGERYMTGTMELFFPTGLPEEYGLKASIFTDAGVLTELEDSGDNVRDEDKIRVGSGIGLSWRSPFGPIRMDYGKAIVKDKYDEAETFRINFGTRF